MPRTPSSPAKSETSSTSKAPRSRTVPGSCWPCKKSRVKCGLERPICRRCASVGAACDYNTKLIRWSKRPAIANVPTTATTTTAKVQRLGPFYHSAATLGTRERSALDYFHSRVWPLLSTSSEPWPAPISVALEHRAVLLTTCLLADSHRLLQDGKGSVEELNDKRVQCLAAVRADVDECCSSAERDWPPLLTLLFAVLFLYIDDGFMECLRRSASTLSHHAGVLAVLKRMGGMELMLRTGPHALQMLLSEFASADLTTAVLRGNTPAFPPSTWDIIDEGAVWWGREGQSLCSLAPTFKQMSRIASYLEATTQGAGELSMLKVREFEDALRPVYAAFSAHDSAGPADGNSSGVISDLDQESLCVFSLIRAFQHCALIYLYRGLCGLSASHSLVQQHVQACLHAIFEIDPQAHVLNCVIFPLCVAGAHALTQSQRSAVLTMVGLIHDNMKFAAVQSVRLLLDAVWGGEPQNMTWTDMFSQLGGQALIL